MGNTAASTPWGRCIDAFDVVMDHGRDTGNYILMASGSPSGVVSMHSACEYFLPQSGAKRIGGVWHFPSSAKLRVARAGSVADVATISSRQYTMIVAMADADAVKLLEPLLTADGRFVPFIGQR